MNIQKFLFRNTIGRLPAKELGPSANPFFRRYTVLKTPLFSIYLHRFFRSDFDTCLHDHPWGFVSIILRGGYYEERWTYRTPGAFPGANAWNSPDGVRYHTTTCWRRPGAILWRPAATAHRIAIKSGSRPWSLIIVGRKVRDWGFWTRDGWKAWRPGLVPICEIEDFR